MKTKLTTTEKRAMALCETIKQSCQTPGNSHPLEVEWIKSATWGANPRILHRGEKVTNVSGCGYCKHSTALADALRFLGETEEEMHSIRRKGGAGVSSVISALRDCGWKLEPVAAGRNYDCYQISRLPETV